MCDSKISTGCTDREDHRLPDGRKVCRACLTCCTSGLAIETPGTPLETTAQWDHNPDMPERKGDASGKPEGFRFE